MWLALALSAVALAPSHPVADEPSVHARDKAAHANVPSVLKKSFATRALRSVPVPSKRVVYGFLPFWTDHTDLPWEQLTHVSFFDVGLNTDGTLGADHNFALDAGEFISTAHGFNAQATVTFTLFGSSAVGSLLGSATARATAINEIADLVSSTGADGAVIDFEYVPLSRKAVFVDFIGALAVALRADNPNAHLGIAMPAVDWNGSYDYDALAIEADALLIMSYDYHYPGGDPGPVSPIEGGDLWGVYSVTWTINDYMIWGGSENRDKFILGIPLYGGRWPALSATIPSGRGVGTASQPTVTGCASSFAVDKEWDPVSQTPYRIIPGDPVLQLFCEDEASLAAKLDLIDAYDLGGAMFWALGYTTSSHSVWADIHDRWQSVDPGDDGGPIGDVDAPGDSDTPGDSDVPSDVDQGDGGGGDDDVGDVDIGDTDPGDNEFMADGDQRPMSKATKNKRPKGCAAVDPLGFWFLAFGLCRHVFRKRLQRF